VDDWRAFEDAVMRPPRTCIWANPDRVGDDRLAAILAEEGVESQPIPGLPGAFRLGEGFRPGRRWWFVAGLAHIQEAASQVPVHLMDVRPGHRVLDLCAAPGGKSAQIAFALGNRGTLLANDLSTDRIKALQGNLDRLGLVNVTTCCRDASNWPPEAGHFDRVLLDAPCSSDGTLRRNPDLAVRLGPELSARFAARQQAMLRRAVRSCRPGGRVLYSTCTLAPEENEMVVRDALREFDGRLRLLPATLPGFVTSPGLSRWRGEDLGEALRRCIRVWPHHNDTGGFFIAVLELEGQADGEPEPGSRVARLTAEQDPRWIEGLGRHYGLPEGAWRGLGIHRQTRRGLHLIAANHAPPAVPAGQGSGLFFLRTNIRTPKLTTAGALFLGRQATRQRIALSEPQRDIYLGRGELAPSAAQSADLRPGQVLATYRGFPLGVALYHHSGTLQSLFPRRWSG
jgi:16S rRNA C967 or C1407 C5-methylase (RsmB/RsmF family)